MTGSARPPRAPRRPGRPDPAYVIVVPFPEVEGPDGPEEQQHRPRDEDHGPDLEQARRAGGLPGHGGVRLRAGPGEGRVRSAPLAPRRPLAAPPGTSGRGWDTHALSPFGRARSRRSLGLGRAGPTSNRRGAKPSPRGCALAAGHGPAPTRLPVHRLRIPCPLHTNTRGASPPTWAPQFAPTSHIRWHKSLPRDSGSRSSREARAVRADQPGGRT